MKTNIIAIGGGNIKAGETLSIDRTIVEQANKNNPRLLFIPTASSDPGVKTRLDSKEKIIALTLDLCGSPHDGCDYRYVRFFEEENIPVTIFVTGNWIKNHPEDFECLVRNPLCDIQNHENNHKPCSTQGNSIYGIEGTKNVQEVIAEVEDGADTIKKHTKKKPCFYRSGTAYYDEVAVEVIQELGYDVIGFNVLGDKGTTYSREQVFEALIQAQPGSVVILHMNHPKKECALGVIAAIKELKRQGFKFVKLIDYADILR